MSYQQYPPYGQPPPQGGYGQQPPPQGYGQSYGGPPPGAYGSPAPPPPQQYGAPYGAPPPQGYGQGYGQAAPYGAPPPPQGYGQQLPYGSTAPPVQQYGGPYGAPYGAPSPAQGQYYQQGPPQGYAPPPPQQYPPAPPSTGYGAPQIINWNGDADADALRRAMKGFGTDEKTLIRVLATKDPLQIATIRDAFHRMHRRNLEADIKSETSGWFEYGLLAIIRGPLQQDVHVLHEAMSGPGTKETVLNDVLLSRTNADLNAIKSAYQRTYHKRLEEAVKDELSFKTERHFMIVLSAQRAEPSAPVIPSDVQRDVNDLYNATEGKVGTDEIKVCSIMSQRNDDQLRAISYEYKNKYARSLEDVIRKEFSGHMEDALLHQLRHGIDKYMHQAQLLEDAMAGVGTKDSLLINRVIRSHWDRTNMANVRGAYEQRYRKSLASRIKSETSGHYETLMLACIGEQV